MLHQAVFGSLCPSNLLRGAGDTQASRDATQAKMREEFKIIKAELDEFRYSFPEKFYVCNVKEDKNKKNKKPD